MCVKNVVQCIEKFSRYFFFLLVKSERNEDRKKHNNNIAWAKERESEKRRKTNINRLIEMCLYLLEIENKITQYFD